MTEPDQAYRDNAETLAALVGQMIGYLEQASERTVGGRWRKMAEKALSDFKTAKMRQRQRNLFDEGES
jgi:hypothetical protein